MKGYPVKIWRSPARLRHVISWWPDADVILSVYLSSHSQKEGTPWIQSCGPHFPSPCPWQPLSWVSSISFQIYFCTSIERACSQWLSFLRLSTALDISLKPTWLSPSHWDLRACHTANKRFGTWLWLLPIGNKSTEWVLHLVWTFTVSVDISFLSLDPSVSHSIMYLERQNLFLSLLTEEATGISLGHSLSLEGSLCSNSWPVPLSGVFPPYSDMAFIQTSSLAPETNGFLAPPFPPIPVALPPTTQSTQDNLESRGNSAVLTALPIPVTSHILTWLSSLHHPTPSCGHSLTQDCLLALREEKAKRWSGIGDCDTLGVLGTKILQKIPLG